MKKIIASAFLTLTLLAMSVGTVFAQDTTTTPIIGTVQSVTIETDTTTGDTTVLVTYSYTDETGATQEETVRLSVETAEGLGLVTTTQTTDPETGETLTETIVNDGVIGTEVTIDPATVITGTEEEEAEHPVGSALADFFSETLGVDYDLVMQYHEDGAGFGVIAQALWITTKMEGDTGLFQTIVDAKLSGDYSSITLEDGSSPTNWGQFKKEILHSEKNNSLGDIMSGKSENNDSQSHALDDSIKNKEDKGNNNDKGNKDKGGKDHGNGHGNGH